jgi:hypothetical protein
MAYHINDGQISGQISGQVSGAECPPRTVGVSPRRGSTGVV